MESAFTTLCAMTQHSSHRKQEGSSLPLKDHELNALAEMLNQAIASLASSIPQEQAAPESSERDIDAWVKGPGRQISLMLSIYARLLPYKSFTPRLIVYADNPHGWTFERVLLAGTDCMPDGLKSLNSIMDVKGEDCCKGSTKLWIAPIDSPDETSMFLAYIRWARGAPVYFVVRDGRWSQMESGAKSVLLLHVLVDTPNAAKRQWSALVESQAKYLSLRSREAFDALFKKWRVRLTDDRYEELAATAFHTDMHLHILQECLREMSEPLMLEAFALLRGVAGQFEQQMKFFETKRASLDKEIEKKTKRLRDDLQRTMMLQKGLQERAQRLSRENNELLRKLKTMQGSQSAASSLPIVESLDSLFARAIAH